MPLFEWFIATPIQFGSSAEANMNEMNLFPNFQLNRHESYTSTSLPAPAHCKQPEIGISLISLSV
jgi:hypothetical protein